MRNGNWKAARPSDAVESMILLVVIRFWLTVFGEPPNHEGRAKTEGDADRHAENTPERIHIGAENPD